MKRFALLIIMAAIMTTLTAGAQKAGEGSIINQSVKNDLVAELVKKHGENFRSRILTGVNQTANFWTAQDGSVDDYKAFVINNFISDSKELDIAFNKLQTNLEILYGNLNKVGLDLIQPVQLTNHGDITGIDRLFGSYDPFAHLTQDFFTNKIAFFVLLNFPYYNLDAKMAQGNNWDAKQWAYARVGDMFTSRVPAEYKQKATEAMVNADAYISDYNIMMGSLRDNEGAQLFPKDLKLISHWNLRDELKSQYANPDGLKRQRMIYQVMLDIIRQDIPEKVINNANLLWNPYKDVATDLSGNKLELNKEPNTRYLHILNNFHALREIDKFSPNNPTYIDRKFNEEFEIPQQKIEDLFVEFISSPQVKGVAKIIESRLKRKLEPFDIWYDGFKARSSISEEELNKITQAKYPNEIAFAADMPNILTKLGFNPDKARFIASKVQVDPSRGAGHAAGTAMKTDVSRLRTRIGDNGMDYKGYNIAIHEFGHNVEQTVSLHDVPYYSISGVPNTSFTEAMAFVFQKRDLDLLGMKEENPDKVNLQILDNFWSTYEIMGVALVDMRLWKWLYANPNANAEETKQAAIRIANDVWNSYYAPVFGVKDQPILAIYSHMIDYPLYLAAYPLGHLIEFQIEQYLQGKNLGSELPRMMAIGRLAPDTWMQKAVGGSISVKPTLEATETAIKAMSKKK